MYYMIQINIYIYHKLFENIQIILNSIYIRLYIFKISYSLYTKNYMKYNIYRNRITNIIDSLSKIILNLLFD